MAMQTKYIKLASYVTVFVILSSYVHVSECKREKPERATPPSEYDYWDETTATPDDPETFMKELQAFKVITPMRLVTYSPYTFEGVDYQDMPESFLNSYEDCYYEHVRCIRFRTNFHVVCLYNIIWRGWQNVPTHCQVDLLTCLHRLNRFMPKYGTDIKNDMHYYNGDGPDCRFPTV